MGVFFILLLGTLFVRPAEIIPDLATVPIFYILIIASLLVNLKKVMGLLTTEELKRAPVSTYVLVMLPLTAISHLSSMRTYEARMAIPDFGKSVVFYFTLMAAIDTPETFEKLLKWLGRWIFVAVSITVAQYNQWIQIPGMDSVYDNYTDPETNLPIRVLRICGTGLFADPNDLSILLMSGMGLAVYQMLGGRSGRRKSYWAIPLGFYMYTLTLTHSRGGFLAMMAGMLVLFQSKYGWKRALPIIMVALPVAAILFGGRQTSLEVSGGTGQQRIQLWALGFTELTRHPIFGYGFGYYADITGGLHAHNSFIHAAVELGLTGGVMFTGAFVYVLWNIYKLKEREDEILEPGLKTLRPCLLALLAGSCTGMMTVSRSYTMPTYLLLGMGMAYLQIVDREVPGAAPPLDKKCFYSTVKVSLAFLGLLYIYARTGAKFGG